MSIRIECSCGKKLSIKDEMAGRRVKCPACGVVLTVPKIPTKAMLAEEDCGNERTDTDYFDKPLPPRTGRSQARLTSASRPSGRASGRSKANAKSGGNRTRLIVASAGIAVLAIGIAAWMLWSAGSDTAVANSGSEIGKPSDSGTAASSPQPQMVVSNSVSSTSGNEAATATSAPAVAASPIEGALKLLQGTWQVTDFKTDAIQPTPPEALSEMKDTTWTFDGKILIMRNSGNRSEATVNAFSVQINDDQSLKTLELTKLSGVIANVPNNISILYQISEDILTICSSMRPGSASPAELVANSALGHAVASFTRSPTNIFPPIEFDCSEWVAASERLKLLDVKAELLSDNTFGPCGDLFAQTRDLKLVDGLIPPQIWNELLALNIVFLWFDKDSLITDATLQQLSQHQGVIGIGVYGSHAITSAGVKQLQRCPKFGKLSYISKTPLSEELLNSFTERKELTNLVISGHSFSKDMIRSIVGARKMKRLILVAASITDDDLVQISTLTSLEGLNLEDSPITDKGLESLKNLKALNFLGLSGTKVSDIGLQSLKALPSLKILYLERTSITPQALAEFQAAVPGCRVVK
jgi:uncharacterized protein (TIGR03067 family)